MLKRILRQNAIAFVVIILSFILVGMMLYYADEQIYKYFDLYYGHPHITPFMIRPIAISIISFALFLCLILLITYSNIKKFKKIILAQKAIIYALAKLTELRDLKTGQHLERTTRYAIILAQQLQKNKKYSKIITNDFIEDLTDAAFLHDIGKVGIRDSILLKQDKLTPDEIKEMQKHAQIGKQELDRIIKKFHLTESFLKMASNICGYHHEKYDGTGYYRGLKKNQIPIEARIFALADTYDTIRSARPYKPALSHRDAIKKITQDKGKYFDPDIVDAFLQCEQEFLQISKQNSEPQM
ncbi:MAG: HD domain-containing protein [Gammaproteobacteria bacterium]|jgi:putative two-component system response regulator